jgi:hypothetical protein
MLDENRYDTVMRLRRKARTIALEAGRAAPTLAMQLRALAARYEAEAEELGEDRRRPLDS